MMMFSHKIYIKIIGYCLRFHFKWAFKSLLLLNMSCWIAYWIFQVIYEIVMVALEWISQIQVSKFKFFHMKYFDCFTFLGFFGDHIKSIIDHKMMIMEMRLWNTPQLFMREFYLVRLIFKFGFIDLLIFDKSSNLLI